MKAAFTFRTKQEHMPGIVVRILLLPIVHYIFIRIGNPFIPSFKKKLIETVHKNNQILLQEALNRQSIVRRKLEEISHT